MSDRTQSVVGRRAIGLGAASWREYLELCKPKVVLLMVFTAIVGMFLAVPGLVPVSVLVFASTGIALTAAAGAAFNHVLDRETDAAMGRTSRRPLPSGRIDRISALAFASVMCVGGVLLLVLAVNPLTALLTFLSMVGYSLVYTLYLKWATPHNIVIGGAAGAMPPVLGWTAVTGHLAPEAWLLFLIIFAWTPPHFWALAIHRCDDYARASVPMLPVTHGVDFTRGQILLYTILLFVVALLPFVTGMSGWLYVAGAFALGAGFLRYAVALYRRRDDRRLPMQTFAYSIYYLAGLFGFLLADHYLH
jgi:protoheme IX farnesyltransferase